MLGGAPVQVRRGHKIVEVVSAQVSKGAAVRRVVEGGDFDFGLIVCAGDDRTDESMFELREKSLLTIKVGAGSTAARYRVPDPAALRRWLREQA